MVRYRSDESDEDRNSSRKHKKKARTKKKRGRSRSGSDSESSHVSSSRGKKSKKRYARSSRSPSRERDQGRSSRRSRSSSYDRYYGGSSSRRSKKSRTRSRSPSARRSRYSRSPYHSRSRSPSARKSRRSRSSSWSRDQRGRSRSYSQERRSRSTGRSQSRRSSPDSRADGSADMKRMNLSEQSGQTGTATVLTPAQQAEERMRLALKAAAAADQKLRQLPSTDRNSPASGTSVTPAGADNSQAKFSSFEESQSFASSVAAIDSGNFRQATFKSSRTQKPQELGTFDLVPSHDDAIFGSLAVTGFTLKPDPDTKPLELNPETIMHPSLFCDPEEKLDRWIERLSELRRRKLEGDAL